MPRSYGSESRSPWKAGMGNMTSEIRLVVTRLIQQSIRAGRDPMRCLPLDEAPGQDVLWIPEELISLHGTAIYATLTEEQIVRLSQMELALFCSILCHGERELVVSLARMMLKKNFRDVRSYLCHLVREEVNHIYMFSEFCTRYAEFHSSRYSYMRGDPSTDSEVDDMITMAHVLIFEEIGQSMNMCIARASQPIPLLIREINILHVEDEGRHIGFGRCWVRTKAREVLARLTPEVVARIQDQLREHIDALHRDFFNVKIYARAGIEDAYSVRTNLVEQFDAGFFERLPLMKKRFLSLLAFLRSCELIGSPDALGEESNISFPTAA
jgi:P-aminobenzoate N-oxygenase AurF